MKITNSYYVSRSTGDKITIRTVERDGSQTYVVYNGGRRVAEYRRRSSVRRYVVQNDCHQVESHRGEQAR